METVTATGVIPTAKLSFVIIEPDGRRVQPLSDDSHPLARRPHDVGSVVVASSAEHAHQLTDRQESSGRASGVSSRAIDGTPG